MIDTRPLDHLNVVDFGAGLAGSLACQMLKDLGAVIHRVEPSGGDPFYAFHSAYALWQSGKHILYADTIEAAVHDIADRLAEADVCIIGGESHPDYRWRPDVAYLEATYPQLVILDITGGRFGTAEADLPAADLLVQARTGLVFEQFPDRPSVFALPAGSYGAALQGLIATFAALCDRERTGLGQIVRTSLVEGVLAWLGHDWYKFEQPTPVAADVTPKGAPPLIFRCADGKYLHIILASTDARKNVYTLLGVENPVPSLEEDPRGMPSIARGALHYYDNVEMLNPYVRRWKRDDLLAALWAKGVSAEAVNAPGEPWAHEQVLVNRLIVAEENGSRRVGLPFDISFGPECEPADLRSDGDVHRPPLQGLRVIDFGTFTAGPHSSAALGDLGADIIKIEALSGDVMRFYFLKYTASSRGKRVIALDLKTAEGIEIAMMLCMSADMVHHNFRPGVTKRLGIDVESLHERKPDLIVLETAAYGIIGPKAQNAGFDMIFHSYAGHAMRGVGAGQQPRNYRLPMVDFSAGMIGTIASLLAQYVKLRTGAGAAISTSLLNCGLYLLSELVQKTDGSFAPLPVLNADETGFSPSNRLYRASDAWIAIVIPTQDMADRFLEVLALSELIRTGVEDWGDAEVALIADAFAPREAANLLKALADGGIWAEACQEDAPNAFLSDPALVGAGGVVNTLDPVHGPFSQLGAQFSFSRSHLRVRGDSPTRGQHTRQILEKFNVAPEEIEQLYARRIVA